MIDMSKMGGNFIPPERPPITAPGFPSGQLPIPREQIDVPSGQIGMPSSGGQAGVPGDFRVGIPGGGGWGPSPLQPKPGSIPSGGIGTGQPQPFAPIAGQIQQPGAEREQAMAQQQALLQQQQQVMGTAGPIQQRLPQGMMREQLEGVWGEARPGTPEADQFPYPEQWQTATDIYGQLAGGMPGMTPEYAQQAWLPYKRQAEQQAMQARESAGLSGMRWSSPLAGQLEETWAGAGERFGSEMEKMRMQDIQGQRMAMLGAAGGLGGLGGQYAQLPLTVSESMMRQGFTQQQMQQQEYDRQRDEWLRQQPEYSPLLPYMGGGAQVPTGPEMYGPSFGGQMLDIGGQMAMYNMLNPKGGGAPTSPRGGGYYPQEWGQFR